MRPCKSCKKKIRTIEIVGTGEKIPVDIKPVKAVYTKKGHRLGLLIDVFIPHLNTCPEAEKFKKKITS